MAVLGGGGRSSPRSIRSRILWEIRASTADQAPVADLALRGSSGLSAATTTNVGRGQCSPPTPTTEQMCSTCSPMRSLDLKCVAEEKPSGKMYPALCHPGSERRVPREIRREHFEEQRLTRPRGGFLVGRGGFGSLAFRGATRGAGLLLV